jgi:hypothetical protein
MVAEESLLVTLVKLVDRIPSPPVPAKRCRGKPRVYSEKLFLKALVIMIVKHLSKVHELLAVLEQPTAEMRALRALLTEDGKYPSRRTWERRLKGLPESLPGQIACLGTHLVVLVQPWAQGDGQAVALDSTLLRASGGVWHQKHRQKGHVPHTSIDTEAHWTKSGWHGWVYGWKLHIACTVAGAWIPLAARLTPANAPDSGVALQLLPELPAEARYILGDTHYNTPEVGSECEGDGRILVATRHGKYPHTDDGVEVRRIFHELRSRAIENFNEQFKGMFDGHASVPTKGLANTSCWALGAVFVYQLVLLYRHEHHQPLRVGLKPFLKAA